MIVILILDVVSSLQWKESDYIDYVYDSDTWHNYQCFSARVVISSNYSLSMLNFIAIVVSGKCDFNIWCLKCCQQHDAFRVAWNAVSICVFGCYSLWIIMYGVIGSFVYCWLVLPILIPAIFICRGRCCTINPTEKTWKDHYPMFHQCCAQVFMPIILVFLFGVLALTMINLFEGMGYGKSLSNVLFERRWDDYYENLTAEAVFRWITAIFG